VDTVVDGNDGFAVQIAWSAIVRCVKDLNAALLQRIGEDEVIPEGTILRVIKEVEEIGG